MDPAERDALRQITRRGVLYAAALGAASAGISAVAMDVADRLYPLGDDWWGPNGPGYWAVAGGAMGLAALIEIVLLYWDALASIKKMAAATGFRLESSEALQRRSVAAALVRAALELPGPTEPAFGINPLRETSRLKLVLAGVLYKGKIALTGFVVKLVLRRALGRAAARAALNWVGVPVTAIWNAYVCAIVFKEARLRLLGPSAVSEILESRLFSQELSEVGKQVCFRAVAASVVRTGELHPNHWALLALMKERYLAPTAPEIDDTERFIAELAQLPPQEQRPVLELLVFACILDGRLSRRERQLLKQAAEASKHDIDIEGVRSLKHLFLAGQSLLDAMVRRPVIQAAKEKRPSQRG